MECPDLKLFSSPPLWGLSPPALARMLQSGRTLDGTWSRRGTRQSPTAWGSVRTLPAPSSGSEHLNLTCEGNAVTATLRKKKSNRWRKWHMLPQTCKALLLKETRQGDTDTQTDNITLKSFSKKKVFCLLAVFCEVNTKPPPDTGFLGKPPLPLCLPRLKFALHDLLNWKIVKGK